MVTQAHNFGTIILTAFVNHEFTVIVRACQAHDVLSQMPSDRVCCVKSLSLKLNIWH